MHNDVLKYDGRIPDQPYVATEGSECGECERYIGLLLWALHHHQEMVP